MHMPQGNVVELVVHAEIDVIQAAELDFVVSTLGRRPKRRDQLMRQDDVALGGVDVAGGKCRLERRSIAVPYLGIREEAPHVAGL